MDDIHPGAARFDDALGAWVLTSYADVSAALREPRLSVSDGGDEAAHAAVREAAARALSPARLAAWRAELEPSARELAGTLPVGVPVDLVDAFARPWSTALAARVTGAPPADAERLDGLARAVFLAAACATGSVAPVSSPAHAATAELARSFPATGASADVQGYVALTQTLPCLLAAAWLALLRHPAEMLRLRACPELMPGAVEELLRYASPSRAVFRRALAQLSFGDAHIAAGERVVLMLSAANHDPARFPEPERLDVGRDASGHLAFGRGSYSCSGAPVIRLAVAVATEALLGAARAVELAGEAEWIGGFAIRGPATLPVVVRR